MIDTADGFGAPSMSSFLMSFVSVFASGFSMTL